MQVTHPEKEKAKRKHDVSAAKSMKAWEAR